MLIKGRRTEVTQFHKRRHQRYHKNETNVHKKVEKENTFKELLSHFPTDGVNFNGVLVLVLFHFLDSWGAREYSSGYVTHCLLPRVYLVSTLCRQ